MIGRVMSPRSSGTCTPRRTVAHTSADVYAFLWRVVQPLGTSTGVHAKAQKQDKYGRVIVTRQSRRTAWCDTGKSVVRSTGGGPDVHPDQAVQASHRLARPLCPHQKAPLGIALDRGRIDASKAVGGADKHWRRNKLYHLGAFVYLWIEGSMSRRVPGAGPADDRRLVTLNEQF